MMRGDDGAGGAELAALGARRLTRGITATWWYTLSAVLFLELLLVLVWVGALVSAGAPTPALLIVAFGGLVWVGAGFALLHDYRFRSAESPMARWRRAAAPLVVSVVYGVAAGLSSGILVIAVVPLVQSLMLLVWSRGLRLRVVVVATMLLAALWVIDAPTVLEVSAANDGGETGWLLGLYSTILPIMTVSSLWWWDVLVTLDLARASESRLAATQERLRVATDVHDLQGHHLQVIALQLELAERLMPRDPGAALEQLRSARGSVDEARQGTRDLALRFRSIPLRDELANAVDLLRAAGIAAESTVDPDAAFAPADVLGPVIRETTTNVLRHGGGHWARLELARSSGLWRYSIVNDAVSDDGVSSGESDAGGAGGSGLDGLRRRAAEAGGAIEVSRERQQFGVTVTLPPAGAR